MNVLVINAGSSSLKYQLLNVDTREVYAKGNCERIGIDGSFIGHEDAGGVLYALGAGAQHLARLDALEVGAARGARDLRKAADELAGDLVGGRLAGGGLQVGAAVCQAADHAGAGERAAGALHAAHAKAQALGGGEHGLLVGADEVGVGAGDGLRAVEAASVAGGAVGDA